MINYYLLMKPGIILGNLATVVAGFLLASKGVVDPGLFAATLAGIICIIASGCVFNNYFDRQNDRKMERTKQRALAAGLISERNAIAWAILLGMIGNGVLALYTNLLTVLVADLGLFIYAVPYTLWKCHTVYGTAIGSIAGAIPPVVGYCAVSNRFDPGAMILFCILVLWQMPHFFAIALHRLHDYAAAGIPVLPLVNGVLRTKIRMVAYIFAFIIAASMLTFFNYTGSLYLLISTTAGLIWLGAAVNGLHDGDDQLWGRRMFQLSLVAIAAICVAIPLDIA